MVDDRQHHRQHGGVLSGEERALQRLFQPADLTAHLPAGHGRERVRVALPGGERVQHVPARDTVDVGDHRRELQVPVFEQFLHPLLLGGASLGEVPAVPGVGPQPADRLRRHEAGGDHSPLGDLGEPDGVGPVRFGQAGQCPDLRGVIQVAVEPAGFEQEEHRLPVVDVASIPALVTPQQRSQSASDSSIAAGGAERPGLLLAAARAGVAGHPDGHLDLGLGDVQAGDPLA